MTSGTWRRPMGSRDTGESHRAATPLELHTHLADLGAAAAFTIPVVLYVLAVAFLQTVLHGVHPPRLVAFAAALVLVAMATFTGQPVLFTGIVLAVLVAAMLVLGARAERS